QDTSTMSDTRMVMWEVMSIAEVGGILLTRARRSSTTRILVLVRLTAVHIATSPSTISSDSFKPQVSMTKKCYEGCEKMLERLDTILPATEFSNGRTREKSRKSRRMGHGARLILTPSSIQTLISSAATF